MMRPRFSDDDDDGEHKVRTIGNEMWFWGPVNEESALDLTTELRKKESELLAKQAEHPWDDPPSLTLYIKTEGGCMFSGLSVMDFIWNMRIHVTTVADGCCASAGTFILMGGHQRLIKEYSYVLIHQLSCEFWGKFNDAKDDLKSSSKFMRMARKLYKDNTSLPDKKLSKLMKRDVYLNSSECVKYNVVNGIY